MSSLNNKNVPKGILSISDKNNPPKLNKVKKRCLILSPTVNAGLEPESKITDFEKDREIGKGGFGLVWKVIHKKTQKVYCIKVIQKAGIIEQKLIDQMNREIEIMYILNHPHCLRLKNHFEDDTNFYLVMPLASKGQLYRVLKKFRKFDEKTAAQILRETISALQYLHSFNPPIIHRDIKPENLLLNEGGRVLLADFGWSNFSDGDVRKTFCGTPEYIAPEMLLKKGHDTRVDIWSIGILMFELLAGYSPFVAKTHQELYQNIKKLKINWPRDMSALAKNLISSILKTNPNERLSFEKILEHPWFQNQKMIKPLLENKLNTLKDLLAFHMISEANDEILGRINNLLNLKGQDADNTNAKNIIKENPDSEKIKAKNNVMKQIETPKKVEIKNEKLSEKKDTKDINSDVKYITSINIGKEEKDLLILENTGLKKDNELYKNKLISIEKEARDIKAENEKLKSLNSASLKEMIKKKEEEIEKLNSLNQNRMAILNELEEKNKITIDLKTKIQVIQNNKLQKDKELKLIQNKIKDMTKQLEVKDKTIKEMNKKNESLEQEKEQLFLSYQKKIKELQSKVLDNSKNSTEDENSMEEGDQLGPHIDTLNGSIDIFKNVFDKKINNYKENFEQFQKEGKTKDENFNKLLINKTNSLNELIKKYSAELVESIPKMFSDMNKQASNGKDKKISWLNQQISELMVCKKDGINYENKIKEFTNYNSLMEKKIKCYDEYLKLIQKNIKLKKESITIIKDEKNRLDSRYDNIKNFLEKNSNAKQKQDLKKLNI